MAWNDTNWHQGETHPPTSKGSSKAGCLAQAAARIGAQSLTKLRSATVQFSLMVLNGLKSQYVVMSSIFKSNVRVASVALDGGSHDCSHGRSCIVYVELEKKWTGWLVKHSIVIFQFLQNCKIFSGHRCKMFSDEHGAIICHHIQHCRKFRLKSWCLNVDKFTWTVKTAARENDHRYPSTSSLPTTWTIAAK